MVRYHRWIFLALCFSLLAGSQTFLHAVPASKADAADYPTLSIGYEIVHEYPHDEHAFTEGLIFLNGDLYESTGNYGESNLRKVDLATGKVLQQTNLSIQYFGEGLTALNGKLYQLTWQENKAFVYDLATFNLETNFTYSGEGWGLTTDGKSLIMSDGSAKIRFLDPTTFKEQRTIKVMEQGHPVKNLNELEYIKDEIFANIWYSDDVVKIDPATGKVIQRISFFGLRTAAGTINPINVLNGIAYDSAGDRLFLTGKNWPKLFEIKFK